MTLELLSRAMDLGAIDEKYVKDYMSSRLNERLLWKVVDECEIWVEKFGERIVDLALEILAEENLEEQEKKEEKEEKKTIIEKKIIIDKISVLLELTPKEQRKRKIIISPQKRKELERLRQVVSNDNVEEIAKFLDTMYVDIREFALEALCRTPEGIKKLKSKVEQIDALAF